MKQVICIRKDLKMRRGKEIAQGAHASSKFMVDLLSKGKSWSDKHIEWLNSGTKKVCVQINSEQEMIDLWNKAREKGITAHMIKDSGLTEFDGVPTLTALAIGPDHDELIDTITGHLSLY